LKKLIIISALILSGCASAHIHKTTADNGTVTCTADFSEVFRDYKGVQMSACGGEGGASGAESNNAFANALLGALVKGFNPAQ